MAPVSTIVEPPVSLVFTHLAQAVSPSNQTEIKMEEMWIESQSVECSFLSLGTLAFSFWGIFYWILFTSFPFKKWGGRGY